VAWFKEHGFIKWPKKIEEAYPRSFLKPRIPIYFEHFIKAGEDVKRVTNEMGIDWWDVSDYQPFPDWKPCPDYEKESPEYDLYAVNFRVPFHTFTYTTNNVWLNELGEYHPSAYNILINSQAAKRKGIKDGDIVRLETEAGDEVEGRVKVTETVHPEVVGVAGCFGHWAKALPVAKGKGVHYNSLVTASLERIDMMSGAVDCCIKVKVSKIGEVKK
jgi:molybdopterin-containing oxidoreductase family molybdopterin binding subunit